MYDLVVIGGGVWGVSAAAAAVEGGVHSVLLLEARPGVGSEASAKAGGIVTDLLWHPEDQAWVSESRALYDAACRASGDATMVQRLGLMTLADPSRHHLLEARAGALRERGIPTEVLAHAEMAARFPELAVAPADVAALWLPQDWHVNATAYCQQTVAAAREQGLQVRTAHRVVRIAVEDRRVMLFGPDEAIAAERVLVASGSWTRKLVQTAGFDIPLRPYRVQLASLAMPAGHRFPMVWDLATDVYLVPDGPRAFLAGDGTRLTEHDPDAYQESGDADFHEDLARRVPELVAVGRDAHLVTSWAGVVGATPDRRPLLGYVGERLAVACGDNGFGVMRGPAIGRLAGRIALGEAERPHLSPLRTPPDYFPIRPGFTLED